MEPDILASAGEPRTTTGPWLDAKAVQTEEVTKVETPSDIANARAARLHAVSAHHPALPRARSHAGGFVSGHARPRTAAPGTWRAPADDTAAPAILPFETPADEGVYLRAGKRFVDIVGASLALIVLSPVIALLAIIIRLTTHGPVFYRSKRIGRGGHEFTFYKLRSMVKDAHKRRDHLSHLNECKDGPVFKNARDPRITPNGRFMRSTSLDEVPQFWNVLRGDMSLVGPRPPIPEEVAQYEPWQLRRLDVRPGLTCLWQISGRSRIGFQEWMRLDLEYIRHRSLKLDLKILLRTIPAVLSREGAY